MGHSSTNPNTSAEGTKIGDTGISLINLSKMIGHGEKAVYKNGMVGAVYNPNGLQNLN